MLSHQPDLPFARRGSSHSRHASYSGAVTAAPRAGSQADRIYELLRVLPFATYHDLAEDVGLPLATICARMAALRKAGKVESAGTMIGPYGARRTVWRAR